MQNSRQYLAKKTSQLALTNEQKHRPQERKITGSSTLITTQLKSTSYEELMQFISHNRAIPDFLAGIQSDNKNIALLVNAIKAGNSKAEIFSHPDCALYLLYLTKQQLIPSWQGMTVYTYLMALMQFTDKQALQEKDNDVKLLKGVSVGTLLDEPYLKEICETYAAIGYKLDRKELMEFAKKLPPVEQWLMKIPYQYISRPKYAGRDYNGFANILLRNLPFVEKNSQRENSSGCHRFQY